MSRLFGIYEKAMPLSLPADQKLAAAKAAGYDYMEFCIDESERQLSLLERPPSYVRELGKKAVDLGLRMQSMCLSAHRKYSLGSSDKAVAEAGVDICAKAFDFACEAGISLLLIAGYDVFYEPSTELTRNRFLENLGAIACMAQERGLMLGLENVDSEIARDVESCRRIINEIDSPHLRLYLDIGNMNAQGIDYLDEIPKARGMIEAVHLKDTRLNELRNVRMGCGSVDFKKAAGLLKSMGCDAPSAIEMWHQSGEEFLRAIADALQVIKGIFIE